MKHSAISPIKNHDGKVGSNAILLKNSTLQHGIKWNTIETIKINDELNAI